MSPASSSLQLSRACSSYWADAENTENSPLVTWALAKAKFILFPLPHSSCPCQSIHRIKAHWISSFEKPKSERQSDKTQVPAVGPVRAGKRCRRSSWTGWQTRRWQKIYSLRLGLWAPLLLHFTPSKLDWVTLAFSSALSGLLSDPETAALERGSHGDVDSGRQQIHKIYE